MRVYLPATMTLLARWHATGTLPATTAHAVTPTLREWYTSGDAEELEYAALLEAADASLHLLAADPGTVRRRVVLAAEVPDTAVRPTPGARSAVAVPDVQMGSVVSVHVDDVDAEPDLATAVAVLPAALAGDDDAQFTVDGAGAHDLLWYDATEIAALLP